MLSAGLNNGLANLTVFAPSDAAFKSALTAVVYVNLLRGGATPGVATQTQAATTVNTLGTSIFSTPSLYGALTAQTVRVLSCIIFLVAEELMQVICQA